MRARVWPRTPRRACGARGRTRPARTRRARGASPPARARRRPRAACGTVGGGRAPSRPRRPVGGGAVGSAVPFFRDRRPAKSSPASMTRPMTRPARRRATRRGRARRRRRRPPRFFLFFLHGASRPPALPRPRAGASSVQVTAACSGLPSRTSTRTAPRGNASLRRVGDTREDAASLSRESARVRARRGSRSNWTRRRARSGPPCAPPARRAPGWRSRRARVTRRCAEASRAKPSGAPRGGVPPPPRARGPSRGRASSPSPPRCSASLARERRSQAAAASRRSRASRSSATFASCASRSRSESASPRQRARARGRPRRRPARRRSYLRRVQHPQAPQVSARASVARLLGHRHAEDAKCSSRNESDSSVGRHATAARHVSRSTNRLFPASATSRTRSKGANLTVDAFRGSQRDATTSPSSSSNATSLSCSQSSRSDASASSPSTRSIRLEKSHRRSRLGHASMPSMRAMALSLSRSLSADGAGVGQARHGLIQTLVRELELAERARDVPQRGERAQAVMHQAEVRQRPGARAQRVGVHALERVERDLHLGRSRERGASSGARERRLGERAGVVHGVVEEKPRAATAVAHLAHLALVARPPVRDLHARRNRGRPRSRVRGTSAASLAEWAPGFPRWAQSKFSLKLSNAFQIGRDALLPRPNEYLRRAADEPRSRSRDRVSVRGGRGRP